MALQTRPSNFPRGEKAGFNWNTDAKTPITLIRVSTCGCAGPVVVQECIMYMNPRSPKRAVRAGSAPLRFPHASALARFHLTSGWVCGFNYMDMDAPPPAVRVRAIPLLMGPSPLSILPDAHRPAIWDGHVEPIAKDRSCLFTLAPLRIIQHSRRSPIVPLQIDGIYTLFWRLPHLVRSADCRPARLLGVGKVDKPYTVRLRLGFVYGEITSRCVCGCNRWVELYATRGRDIYGVLYPCDAVGLDSPSCSSSFTVDVPSSWVRPAAATRVFRLSASHTLASC